MTAPFRARSLYNARMFPSRSRIVVLALGAVLAVAAVSMAQPPVARPQPPPPVRGTQTPPPQTKPPKIVAPPARPAPPSAEPAQEAAPTEAALGISIFPSATFLGSYDAGRGQRFYLFGVAASFNETVAYYRTALKDKGELVFDVPATHTFDVGKYKETDVAFPPGVTIKDYSTGGMIGFANPRPGATPASFPTVVQIVPAPPAVPGGQR